MQTNTFGRQPSRALASCEITAEQTREKDNKTHRKTQKVSKILQNPDTEKSEKAHVLSITETAWSPHQEIKPQLHLLVEKFFLTDQEYEVTIASALSEEITPSKKNGLIIKDFVYYGDTTDNFANGVGTLVMPSRNIYKGTFKNGYLHGTVRHVNHQEMWTGTCKNGLKHGSWNYFASEEGWTSLIFQNDIPLLSKQQKKSSRSASKEETISSKYYSGSKTWEITFSNGMKYQGEVNRGVFNGKGKLYKDLPTFQLQGNFQEGSLHGSGKAIYPVNIQYEGLFSNGVPHGKGRFTFPNGIHYSGDIRNGCAHGTGKIERLGRLLASGKFINGKLIEIT